MDDAMNRPVLQARKLTFGYPGEAVVLQDVDLGVHAGSALAVMGPSGSGKSTLLHVLGGLIVPTSGSVRLHGSDVSSLAERRRDVLRLKRMGFVFQFGELIPELTMQENVELPLLFQGHSRKHAAMAASHALETVGLGAEADRFQHQVSGGQQQRAAIARAVVHRPAVLLADEPTGSLDDDNASLVLDLLMTHVRDHGAALVMVTHSRDVADRCDEVLYLRHGSLRAPAIA